MIKITDDDLKRETTTMGYVLLLLQAELEVAVFSGTDTVLITSGDQLAVFTGFTTQTSSLSPIEVPGFEGVVNDLYLSRVLASWTTERGGALRLRAVFEEEGVEVRGGLADVDFDHLHLDVFLLPSLDAADHVVWETQLGFELDGGVLTDILRGRIETELLNGEIVAQILDALDPLTDQLNQLVGLHDASQQDLTVQSITITEGEAKFDNVSPFQTRFAIAFDAVEVHDDTDGTGQGELLFSATAAGIDIASTEPVSAGSGTVVPLEGSGWRISPVIEDGLSISLRFEAFDLDGDNRKSLGVVNTDLDPSNAPLVMRLRADTGNFTLLARLEPRGDVAPAPGARHLRVSIPSVRVLHDLDTGGAGEVRFWALANGQPTAVSEETDVKGGDDPEVPLALTVDLFLPAGDDLEIRVVGWDVDPSQRDWMGEVRTVVAGGAIGTHKEIARTSDTGDFEATINIVDLDAPVDPGPVDPDPTDPGETVRRLIVLESVSVRRDGDVGPGELRLTATVNDVVAFHNEVPIETSSGTLLPLVGNAWRVELDVPVAEPLSVGATVVDVDATLDDPTTPQNEAHESEELLGDASLSVDPLDERALGEHVMSDTTGDATFRVRILDPAAREGEVQAMVRFAEIEVLHDHATAGRGSLWCAGSVKGFPVGDAVASKAGRGDAIVLDPAAWTAGVGVDPGEELELAFGVLEARDPDHVSLGAVRVRATFPWSDGLLEATSDEGDFLLRYRVWDPTVHGANRLSVTFLEVTVLDDGEPTSEGELRFLGAADELQTGLSVLQKARTGETVPLVGLPWTLAPRVDAGDELTVTFTVYAEDAGALARLDHVEESFAHADGWGIGEHVVTSQDERFRVRFAVTPAADELPDLPDLVPLLVEFTTVEVSDDGDGLTRGDISFAGTVNGVVVLQTEEFSVDSGDSVSLGAPLAPRTVWLRTDQDLDIELTATEHDGRREQVLGTSRHVHRAVDGWELGVHDEPGGGIVATWRVDRADGPRARVKFLQVHVFDDDEPVKRGDIVCEGTVNGVSTGESLTMKAGSDGASSADNVKSDIFIGGPRWSKTVSYDPDAPQLDVRFTVTELDRLSPDDPLGTASLDASAAFDAPSGIRIFTQLADSGKFEVTCIAQALS